MSKKKQPYERPVIQKLHVGLMNKYGRKSDYEAVSTIDGVDINDLTEKYGSPLFVLSESSIRSTLKNAKRAFSTRYPKVQFAWSYKTNYLDAVCNIFHQEGSWAEVVSGFEFDKALSNGVPGSKIIFNGPGKTSKELKKALDHRAIIHIDNIEEFYLLKEINPDQNSRPRVAVRVNMDTGVFPTWDRFGFNFENGEAWDIIKRIVSETNFDLCGLHAHIGTFMLSPSSYAKAASKLGELTIKLESELHRTIEYLDLGGGFASRNTLKGSFLPGEDSAPSFDQYAEAICTELLKLGVKEQPTLVLETGRALIDEAGFLIGEILSQKRLPDGRKALVLNFGVNILFTSFWYDHRISPVNEPTTTQEDTVFYGPLCMNIDVIRDNMPFPSLSTGEKIVVHNVGAYNMTQWMQFITLRPAVVLIDQQGKTHVIREAETASTLQSQEKLPSHLKKINLV